jgi:hypothetical protein
MRFRRGGGVPKNVYDERFWDPTLTAADVQLSE